MLTSVKTSEKLPSKANSSNFLQLNCSDFRLKLCERSMKGLRVTKIVKQIKFEGVRGDLETKKMFLETIMNKIFETNSSFYVK